MNAWRGPGPAGRALAVTAATLRRMLRDRGALFFMVLLPIGIIVVVGVTVRGFDQFRVGVVANDARGQVSRSLVGTLEHSPGLRVHTYPRESAARTALRRSELDVLVVVPPGLDRAAPGPGEITIPVLVSPASTSGQAAATAVESAVAGHAGRVEAARFAVTETGGAFDDRFRLAGRAQAGSPTVAVTRQTVNGQSATLPLGYSYSTPTMLVLFVFINAVSSGAAIVQNRQSGVYARALAAPIGAGTLILGETLAYLLLALVQSALIVGIGSLAFGVAWGASGAAAALIVLWALVGTGAGLAVGALFRTPEQVHSIGPAVGVTMGMLGGCMWPLAVVPGWLRAAGHAVPQAWAVDSWTELLSHHGGLPDILGRLAVLAGYAVFLLLLATLALRRRLTTLPG
ncbi:ABC transporter permease [Phaeacidiphilus oryzae]|uniref:ABC transporter permease n=1 Tax=Phaeacidiphilus oryzae TaxID=348818 RepID=UPI0005631375|nr:ABC transporter permease [Phaeacidiphilus oryzae]